MLIEGYTSVLIERTVITNSEDALDSIYADIMIKNVDVINCTYSHLLCGRAMVRRALTMNNSSLSKSDQELHIHSRKSKFYDEKSYLLITHNLVTGTTIRGVFFNSTVTLSGAELLLKENECHNISTLLITQQTNIIMESGSIVRVTQNRIYSNSFLVGIGEGLWNSSSDSQLSVTENFVGQSGLSFSFLLMNVTLQGPVALANNTVNTYGALNILSSRVWFHGRLEVMGNRGQTGAITAVESDIFITGTATFTDNVADNGGALTLILSVMFISTSAKVNLARNQAKELGGAIYVSNPRNTYMCGIGICSIQVLPDSSSEDCRLFSITFNQNKAGVAGNAIYGDKTSACLLKS